MISLGTTIVLNEQLASSGNIDDTKKDVTKLTELWTSPFIWAVAIIGLALNKELLFHESYSFSVCNQDFKHMLIIIDYYTNDDQKIIDEFIQRYRKVKSRPLSKSDKEMIRVIKHALHSFSKTIEKWISQNDDSSPFTIKIY